MNKPLTKEKEFYPVFEDNMGMSFFKKDVLSAKNWLKNRLSEEQYLNTNISKLIDEAFDIE